MERELGRTEKNWIKAVETGTGNTIVAFSIQNKIELSKLTSILKNLQNSFQILRAELPPGENPNFFTFSPIPTLEIEIFDSDTTSEIIKSWIVNSGEISPFQCLVEHELNRNPWISAQKSGSKRLIFAAVFDSVEFDESVVILRIHSAICDRVSGNSVLKLILDDFCGISCVEGIKREVCKPIEDLTADLVVKNPIWRRGMNVLGYSLNFTKSAYIPFIDTSSARASQIVRMDFSAEETAKLYSVCESRSVKLCSAITAAMLLASAASKLIPRGRAESYTVLTFVNCRKLINPKLDNYDFGFYHSAIQNLHSVKQEEDLWDVAKRCHAVVSKSMEENKHISDMADLNMLMRKAIDNPFLTPSSSMRTALVSIFEETIEYSSLESYRAAGVKDFIACASVHGVSPSIAIFEAVIEGRLQCNCLYPSPVHSRDQIQAVVDHAKKLLLA